MPPRRDEIFRDSKKAPEEWWLWGSGHFRIKAQQILDARFIRFTEGTS
jgi:hypothetical protein